jgi:excisionase family DNA binding protein
MLGVHESKLRRWSDAGWLATFRTPGGHRRVAEDDVRKFLKQGAAAGPGRHVGWLAVTAIRRRLHRSPPTEAAWHAGIAEEHRERLRFLGRRLAALASSYLTPGAAKAPLLEEARAAGRVYGRELDSSGLSQRQAVQAFVFFRRSLEHTARRAAEGSGLGAAAIMKAGEDVLSLADEVLIGISEGYERLATPGRPRALTATAIERG